MASNKITLATYKQMYQDVFGSEQGKIVLSDLCKRFHMMSASNPELSDGLMRFREGERNAILFILSQVDFDIEKLRNLRKTHQVEISYDD